MGEDCLKCCNLIFQSRYCLFQFVLEMLCCKLELVNCSLGSYWGIAHIPAQDNRGKNFSPSQSEPLNTTLLKKIMCNSTWYNSSSCSEILPFQRRKSKYVTDVTYGLFLVSSVFIVFSASQTKILWSDFFHVDLLVPSPASMHWKVQNASMYSLVLS